MPASGAHVWAERYDRDLSDIFAVQGEIATSVAGVIEPAVADAEQQRVLRKPPERLDAWEAYQRGLWHFSNHGPGRKRGRADLFSTSHRARSEIPAWTLRLRTGPAMGDLALLIATLLGGASNPAQRSADRRLARRQGRHGTRRPGAHQNVGQRLGGRDRRSPQGRRAQSERRIRNWHARVRPGIRRVSRGSAGSVATGNSR